MTSHTHQTKHPRPAACPILPAACRAGSTPARASRARVSARGRPKRAGARRTTRGIEMAGNYNDDAQVRLPARSRPRPGSSATIHASSSPTRGRARAGRGPRRGARATRSTGIARSSRIGARRRAAPTPATFAVVRSRASFARDRGRRRAVARPRRAIDAHSRPSRTFRFFRLPRALPITLSPLESRPLTPSSLSSVVFHRSRRSAASWTRRSVRRTRARSSTGSSASSA